MASPTVKIKGPLSTLVLVVRSSVNHDDPVLYSTLPTGKVVTVWTPTSQYLWTLSDEPPEGEFLVAFPYAHKVDNILG